MFYFLNNLKYDFVKRGKGQSFKPNLSAYQAMPSSNQSRKRNLHS